MGFLIATHHPRGFVPAVSENEQIRKDIDDLNGAMVAAGVRHFVGGLHPPTGAITLTAAGDGDVTEERRTFLQGEHYVGGFWVLEVTSESEAIEWGKRAVIAGQAPVEVRQFHG